MRRTIAAVAVAASVLAPASALAECAWVLWWEETSTFSSYRTAEANIPGAKLDERETSSWNILGSYTTNAGCEAAQASKIDDVLKTWRMEKAVAKSGEHTINYTPGSNVIATRHEYTGELTRIYYERLRYLCLPDTVDPRGPKGK